MKIRLMGLPDELHAAVAQIGKVLDIVEVSEPYANRPPSRLTRQYLEVRLVEPASVTVDRQDPATIAVGRRRQPQIAKGSSGGSQ